MARHRTRSRQNKHDKLWSSFQAMSSRRWLRKSICTAGFAQLQRKTFVEFSAPRVPAFHSVHTAKATWVALPVHLQR